MLRKANRKGASRRIAEYVYEDAIGRRAIAKVEGLKPKEKRFAKTDSLDQEMAGRYAPDTAPTGALAAES